MNWHPYTEEQEGAFHEAAGIHVELDGVDAALILRGLHDAGITVTFPEPRYYANDATNPRSVSPAWIVVDRRNYPHPGWTARFNGVNSERYAREHADRLNREASS